MARLRSVIGLLKALGLVSWRDVRSLGSIGGQNFFLFVGFVALQPESVIFFGLILGVVLLFPLSSDPMQKLPGERRAMWPLLGWEWAAIRAWSMFLSPIVWLGIFLLVRAGWRVSALAVAGGAFVQALTYLAKRFSTSGWLLAAARWPPAPPGVLGALVRLHWREMLRTLDPYVALALVVSTELYRFLGKPLDPAALPILSLVTAVTMSTQTQVLFGIDGHGAARYAQLPLRGWKILLAKDLAFLVLLGLLVMPLDLVSGVVGGIAALAIGHRRSVLKPVRQAAWRFTSGALLPDGAIQVAVLFAVGNAARTVGLPVIGLCILAWLASLLFYGWQWDRRPCDR
jgi:hypothetical protein